MNILHIELGRHLAGGPKQVLTLMQALKKKGIAGTLLCPEDSAIAHKGIDLGLNVIPVQYSGEHDLTFVNQLRKAIKLYQPRLVHVHSRRGADTFSAMVARFSRIPFVLTRRVMNKETQWLARMKFNAYQKIIAVSEVVDVALKHQGVSVQNRQIIYDGIDSSDFKGLMSRQEFLGEFKLPDNAIVFANVGRFTHNKNQFASIEAFALIAENNPKAHLILFGDGPLRDELEIIVEAHDLITRVHFAGFKEDMEKWYGGIDILLHTATLEALSVAILEAAACGIPSIAFANGGIKEVIVHNKTGYLAQTRKLDEIAREMERLARNKKLREKMGLEAADRVREYFSDTVMSSAYYQLYRDILKDT